METELIERLVKEAGFGLLQNMTNPPRTIGVGVKFGDGNVYILPIANIKRFAALVAEECAKVCEEGDWAVRCADEIRAKFPKEQRGESQSEKPAK